MTNEEKSDTLKIDLGIMSFRDEKAEKRRVEEERNHRESRLVGRDMEGFFEHGLGAAHRPYMCVNRLRQVHLL